MEEEEKVLREPGEKTREEDLRPAAEKPREETHGHGHHDHIEQDHDRDPDGHGHHHSHDHAHHHGDGEEEESEKGRWILIGFALAVFLAAFFVPEGILRIGMFLAAWLLAGFSVLKEAFLGLIHGELLDEAFLMAVAGIGAIAIGEFPEAAAVMLFYQVGEGLQDLAVQKSRKSIASMMAIRPETACVVRDGQEAAVKPEEVAVGEIIAVRPGERIPLDGKANWIFPHSPARICRRASALTTKSRAGEWCSRDGSSSVCSDPTARVWWRAFWKWWSIPPKRRRKRKRSSPALPGYIHRVWWVQQSSSR